MRDVSVVVVVVRTVVEVGVGTVIYTTMEVGTTVVIKLVIKLVNIVVSV